MSAGPADGIAARGLLAWLLDSRRFPLGRLRGCNPRCFETCGGFLQYRGKTIELNVEQRQAGNQI
jgi:hypothetical protein